MTRRPIDRRFLLVLLCFALSGLAGLIYQTAWVREFSLVFGTSELAVATVLAAYMGGLAAGAGVAARVVHRVRRPVLVYGLLELGIALAALALPLALRAADALLVVAFGRSTGLPEADGLDLALFFLATSFAVLLVPTALMGATLPLLTRHAVRRESEIGSRAGLLYAANTAGAVAGTLLAGFLLLPALGLRQTIHVAVATNVLVFGAAALLSRGASPPVPPAQAAGPEPGARGHALVLWLIALSGLASFTYEVLWTRLLGQVLGGTLYAFSTMLASFLIGIALGSTLASRLAARRDRAARAFAGAQVGTALFSLAAFELVARLPDLALRLEGLALGRLATDAALAIAVLLPPTLCIGASFPLAVRLAARSEVDAGPASGRVFAANTAGAIVGAVGAAFLLVPWLGLSGTLLAAVALNLVLAVAGGWLAPPAGRRVAVAAAVVLAALAFVRPGPPWRLLLTGPLARTPAPGQPVYLGVGRSATVVLLRNGHDYQLLANGLPEALIQPPSGRASKYQSSWLPLLAHLARPEMESLLMVGLGGGMFVDWVPPGVERVDVVELEPEIVAANRELAGRRLSDPFADPRIALHVNDARGALALTEARYDAIVSQPSHPWTTGSSHLFTVEFFRLAREHLTPDGVLVQWMNARYIDVPLLRSMVATLREVFPHVALHAPMSGDVLLLLASGEPLDVADSAPRALAAAPGTYLAAGIATPEQVAASLLVAPEDAARFAGDAPRVRDDRNLLQMRTGRLMGAGTHYAAVRAAAADVDPLAGGVPASLDAVRMVRALLRSDDLVRAERVAAALPPGADRHAARGLLAGKAGQRALALRHLESALREDPEHREARAALLALRVLPRDDAPIPFAAATPLETAVVLGTRHARADRMDAVRALEGDLATAVPGDPLWSEAARLRVRWRVASGRAEPAGEALALLDPVMGYDGQLADLVLRARAGRVAGRPGVVFDSLDELARKAIVRIGQGRLDMARLRGQVAEARRILAALPEGVRAEGWPVELDRAFAQMGDVLDAAAARRAAGR